MVMNGEYYYQSPLLPPPLSLSLSIQTVTHIPTCDGVGINDLRPRLLVLGVLPVPISVSALTAAVVLVVVLGGELEQVELAVDAAESTVNVSSAPGSALGEPVTDPPPPGSLLCTYMV
jgi:hypothetical protein